MMYEFKPVDYKDLKRKDLVRFDYAPLLHRNTVEFVGFVENIKDDDLRVSMSKPLSGYLNLFGKPRKTFERKRISNLRKLEEVVVLEDSERSSDIPF